MIKIDNPLGKYNNHIVYMPYTKDKELRSENWYNWRKKCDYNWRCQQSSLNNW